MKNNTKFLSRKLKSIRVANGYTQREVAKLLGISNDTIVKYERDPKTMKASTIIKLSEIYHTDLFEFFLNFYVTESH